MCKVLEEGWKRINLAKERMLSFVRTKYSDQPGCHGGVQLGTDFGVVGVRQERIHHWPNLRSIASRLSNGEMTHSERLKPGGKGWGRKLRAWNCLQVQNQPQHLVSGGTGAYNFQEPKSLSVVQLC